jgi:hypothetical protein
MKTVLLLYGEDDKSTHLSIQNFENTNVAEEFIRQISSLKLENNFWIDAKIIDEFKKYSIEKEKFPFENIVLINDLSTQKWMREVDSIEICKAIKGTDIEIQNKIIRNLSKRAAAILLEDMDYMGPIKEKDQKESQQLISSIILRLQEQGEITMPEPYESFVQDIPYPKEKLGPESQEEIFVKSNPKILKQFSKWQNKYQELPDV